MKQKKARIEKKMIVPSRKVRRRRETENQEIPKNKKFMNQRKKKLTIMRISRKKLETLKRTKLKS